MNFIYLLENKTKISGARLYVGSKIESFIKDIEGIPTIIQARDGRPYYSSSQSYEMNSDLLSGHTFHASILEVVKNKKKIIERESYWIDTLESVQSEKYYNLANPINWFINKSDAICNMYGETYVEYASRQSSLGKRDSKAIECGFSNFGELHLYIFYELSLGKTNSEISRSMGYHRHFTISILDNINISQFKTKLINQKEILGKLKRYISLGSSFYKACELANCEISLGRLIIGDSLNNKDKKFTVATSMGLSEKELAFSLTEKYLKGSTSIEISKELGLNERSVKRYIDRTLRKYVSVNRLQSDMNLKSNEDKSHIELPSHSWLVNKLITQHSEDDYVNFLEQIENKYIIERIQPSGITTYFKSIDDAVSTLGNISKRYLLDTLLGRRDIYKKSKWSLLKP